jgi:hypothetical protein
MAGFSLQIQGLGEVQRQLALLREGVGELGLKKDRIASGLPYAAGQNYGRYRNGRLARRAGPTFYFEAGVTAIEDAAYDQLAAALPRGASAVRSAWSVLIKRGVTTAQRRAPIKSGDLRRSLHAE